MENLFLSATRNKLRFESSKGLLTVENLWDLSLNSLNELAKGINRKLKDSQEESFIVKKSNTDVVLELQLEILKAVIKTKQEEATTRAESARKNQEIELLEELLVEKKMEGVKSLTQEEIQKRLEALKA